MTVDFLLTDQQRAWAKANRVKSLRKVELPTLADWNYNACPHHKEPTPSCEYRACGFDAFDHQTASAAFHFMGRKTIDGSQTGTGKTNSILLTLCLAKHYKEPLRAVLVVPTSAVAQWTAETKRFAPGLNVLTVTAGLSKQKRLALYATSWEVLIIGFHLMTRDIDALETLEPLQVISDDVDPILQIKNATHKAMIRLTASADRIIIANATNLQTRLQQLYAACLPLGGRDIWGTISSFENRYIKREPVIIHTRNSQGKHETHKVFKATGYKNMEDFKSKFEPLMIRHRYADLHDLRIPDIISENVYVDLYKPQREKYDMLAQGVLELQKKDMPPQQKQVSALTAWTHGGQICAGLPALGEEDGPFASSKLDWVVSHITDDWENDKVVVYARNQGTIKALQSRLDIFSVGHAAIWGGLTGSEERAEEVKRFWEDPNCRVMIISAAGERSLNLQNASIIVSIDMNLNPSRVVQILGRVRRIGSAHARVVAINLLAVDTQEERYMTALASRQALFDAVHEEDNSELFDKLPADILLQLISP